MKISDLIITALTKKGILYEARNMEVDVNIPFGDDNGETIYVNIKCDHMTVKIDKNEE